jgi:4'-phosphopantetheinyl transferase
MSMPVEGRLLTIHCSGPESITPSAEATLALERDAVDLYFATLDGQRVRIAEFQELLDPSEQERAARFRFDVDRERFIIAHGLLRTLLGKHLNARPEELRIARGPYGKPYIEGTDLRFNLSDTKDALLIAFAHGHEIGVDIETMTRTVDHIAVGEHYFTAAEILAIREAGSIATLSSGTVDPPGRLLGAADENPAKRRFLEFWTRKEAVLKASGVGIMDDLRVLRVDGVVNTMTITHDVFMQYAAESYHLHTWHLGEDHIVSVAQEGPINGVRLMGL